MLLRASQIFTRHCSSRVNFKFINIQLLSSSAIRLSTTTTSSSTTSQSLPSTSNLKKSHNHDEIEVLGKKYQMDHMSNITPRVSSKLGRNLHNTLQHPLYHQRKKIEYSLQGDSTPLFVVDSISPVVTVEQNFDQLLVPSDHVSRSTTNTYYVNSQHVLRSHTSAHQLQYIQSGKRLFLVIGDVYRRDEIDRQHYPVFHQIEGVRLFTDNEIFQHVKNASGLKMFENGIRNSYKQERHSVDAVKLVEHHLKKTLIDIMQHVLGRNFRYRWVECYFPFTHPSWELEIEYNDEWIEMLGCGIIEQKILEDGKNAESIGWAFGIGLDRLALLEYNIPDIRLLWSDDRRFLDQFAFDDSYKKITYKPISKYLPRVNDMSFWIPASYSSTDFYDIVRDVAGDVVQQVTLIDAYTNTKTSSTSHCYRIVYEHMERTLSQQEVSVLHDEIAARAQSSLGVKLR